MRSKKHCPEQVPFDPDTGATSEKNQTEQPGHGVRQFPGIPQSFEFAHGQVEPDDHLGPQPHVDQKWPFLKGIILEGYDPFVL